MIERAGEQGAQADAAEDEARNRGRGVGAAAALGKPQGIVRHYERGIWKGDLKAMRRNRG